MSRPVPECQDRVRTLAAGVTWLAGPCSLGEQIVPRLHAAASGRPDPRLVAALPVAVYADAGLARHTADEVFGC